MYSLGSITRTQTGARATRPARRARARDEARDVLATLVPRSSRNDWREIAVRAATREEAEELAARLEDDGYSGIFLVSPARASARLVDRWGRIFRIGPWPREEEPGTEAGEPPRAPEARVDGATG